MPTTDTWSSTLDRMMTLGRVMEQMTSENGEGGSGGAVPFWLPPVDTYETNEAFVVEADLPGVRTEEVEITYKQRTLTLQGTRSPSVRPRENEELRVYGVERMHGRFARSIRLPDYVDGDRISAQFHDGVLTITIPKAPSAQPRRIQIASGAGTQQVRSGAEAKQGGA